MVLQSPSAVQKPDHATLLNNRQISDISFQAIFYGITQFAAESYESSVVDIYLTDGDCYAG
jgi:hypothetical protein